MELNTWQTTLGSCKEKMNYILNTAALADVVFVVGEQRERIGAHSLILRLSSPVFNAMMTEKLGALPGLEGNENDTGTSALQMQSRSPPQERDIDAIMRTSISSSEESFDSDECPRCKSQSYVPKRFRHNLYQDGDVVSSTPGGDVDQNKKITIELPNMEPLSFRFFLKYLYSDEFDIPLRFALHVWQLAKYYQVPVLASTCQDYVNDLLQSDNALLVWQQAKAVHHDQITKTALQYVLFNAKAICTTDAFLKLSFSNLVDLLKEDRLDVDETVLFRIIYMWAENECTRRELSSTPENVRMVLGRLFGLIRFSQMPPHYFTMNVEPKIPFSIHELLALYKFITIPPSNRQTHEVDALNFNRIPRRRVYRLSRYNSNQAKDNGLNYIGAEGRFVFTIDHDITMIGIGMFASSCRGNCITVSVKPDDNDNTNILGYVEKGIPPSNIKYTIVPVLFPGPVDLKKGGYILYYKVRGLLTYYDADRMSNTVSVPSGGVDVTFTFTDNRMLQDSFDVRSRGVPVPEIYYIM